MIIFCILLILLICVFLILFNSCNHEYEYDGDSFNTKDTHYGRYYVCKKCRHEKFICYHDWNHMKVCNPIKYKYWCNRPYSKELKDYINKYK